MLTSVEGIYEHGEVRLLEPLPGIERARVLVTVLPDPKPRAQDPLDLPMTAEERAVWDDLPRFCAEHPIQFSWLVPPDEVAEGGDSRP